VKKVFLALFILLDLALIGGTSFYLFTYISSRMPHFKMPTPAAATSVPASSASGLNPSTGIVSTNTAGTMSPASLTKIFSYRNSHAKHVAIRADFTGWKAEPMQRDSAGVWTYRAILSPGEYAYCFSVDDKPPLKDPVNKRTKLIGRAVVSAIVVEAAPPKSPN
jgi:hypothetical protein